MRSRALELAVFGLEAAVMGGVVALVHLRHHRGQTRDDWLWRDIMVGCLISGSPAMVLSRAGAPPTWKDYERWAITGFCVSAAVVVPWQIGMHLYHRGRQDGYKAKAGPTHDQGAPLERAA